MNIKSIAINKLKAAKYNPRKDLQEGDAEYEKLKNSLDVFGYVDPIIWNERTGNIVGGHQRLKILKAQGIKSVDVSVVDLDDEHEKALNLALNKISGDWEEEKLDELLKSLDADLVLLAGFDDSELFEMTEEAGGDADQNPYTNKITTPVYTPTGDKPEISQMFSVERYDLLMSAIHQSGVPDDVAEFLRLAATRHIVFDYSKVAEFYAHADAQIQELMEQSALVIIDFDKAIEYGYVKVNDEIAAMVDEGYNNDAA